VLGCDVRGEGRRSNICGRVIGIGRSSHEVFLLDMYALQESQTAVEAATAQVAPLEAARQAQPPM
jgi:hypothetical protein